MKRVIRRLLPPLLGVGLSLFFARDYCAGDQVTLSNAFLGGNATALYEGSGPIIDLAVDSNNDGNIDGYGSEEDGYEADCAGKIITIDDPLEVGSDPLKSDVAEIDLNFPSAIPPGLVRLSSASSEFNLQLWADRNKTVPITLPATWDVSQVPSMVYASAGPFSGAGYCYQTNTLRLEYRNYDNDLLSSDTANLTVIGTISRMPLLNEVKVWESSTWDPECGNQGSQALLAKVGQNGWTTYTAYRHGANDVIGESSINAFMGMAYSGILYQQGHYGVHAAFYCLTPETALEWGDYFWWDGYNEDFIKLGTKKINGTVYQCVVAQNYFVQVYWKPVTTLYQSLVVIAGCNSYDVKDVLGGRVNFTYHSVPGHAEVYDSDAVHDNNKLFGNMVGELSSGTCRAAGRAYNGGSDYTPGYTMTGNGNTTLAPAPAQGGIAHFAPLALTDCDATGGALFDTYLRTTDYCVSSAVYKTSGAGSVANQRWMSSPMGSYGVAFDFYRPSGTSLSLIASSDGTIGDGAGAQGRALCGDRHNYQTSESWSIHN